MGYGGYAPASVIVKDALSDFEQALREMPLDRADASLELIEKLTRNVVRSPGEAKFRHINLSNPKISESLSQVPGALDVLRTLGWVDGSDDGGPTLELPSAVRFAFEVEVVKIIEVKDYYKKERENEKRRQKRADLAAEDPEKQALREQFELDRKEQTAALAAKGPTQASHAKKLNDAPNVMRAGDLGIGKSAGG